MLYYRIILSLFMGDMISRRGEGVIVLLSMSVLDLLIWRILL